MVDNPWTNSYIVPIGDLTLSDKQRVRENTDALLWNTAERKSVADQQQDVIVRDLMPFTDFALVTVPAGAEDWLIAGAGVVGTELQYFSVVCPVDRAWVFYGAALETLPYSISRLRITLGATSTTVRGFFDLQPLYQRLEPIGYFSERIVFKPNETCRILVMPKIAWAAASTRLVLLGRAMEPIGQNVSAPSV